jgi:hypothetical protein
MNILDEMPSYRQNKQEIEGIKCLSLLGNSKLNKQVAELEKSFKDKIEVTNKYITYFSNKGWIIYDSISYELIKEAVNIYEEFGFEEAELYLINYYKNDVEKILSKLRNGIDEFTIRYDHIKLAFEDHKAQRYYSSIPQFLMIADGIVNDFTKKHGFFAESTNINAWDCLVGSSNSLKMVKDILNKPRKKTTKEPINMPYRNGILHGRDLNYANHYVSCKCIVLLFAIHDWIANSNNESIRRDKYNKYTESISWGDIQAIRSRTKDIKNRTKNWKKENIIIGETIPVNGDVSQYNDYPYVKCLIEAFEKWKQKNYGDLSKYFKDLFKYEDNLNLRPKECRLLFREKEFKNFELVEIEDRSICLKRILVNVEWTVKDKTLCEPLEFGIKFSGLDGEFLLPPNETGEWNITPWNIQGLYKT